MKKARIRDLRSTETAHNICSGDCCISAVRRAYAEMLELGQPESTAYDAALKVFVWHHPEVAMPSAETLVRGWVMEQFVH